MAKWIEQLLDELGRHIVVHGWADPWSSIPPMVISDDVDGTDAAVQELTASSSR